MSTCPMTITNKHLRNFVLAAVVAALLPAATAQAHYCGEAHAQSAPLYPYAVPLRHQPYTVQLMPNTYRRWRFMRDYPYVRCLGCGNRDRIARETPLVVESRRTADDTPRVIRAEAEITVLGQDNMTIRLFRKRHGSGTKAKSGE